MKGRFLRRNTVTRAMRAELADDLAQLGRPIAANERACCCPARPMVTVMMPSTASRPYPIDLLLCGHHYRVSQAALRAAGATAYDQAWRRHHGRRQRSPAFPPPASWGSAASVTDKPHVPNGLGDVVGLCLSLLAVRAPAGHLEELADDPAKAGGPPGITACDLRPCPFPSARGQHL